ncbi:MAG TPA: LuxR C-terminal-related transcriptional regulator, partial [Devosia sp.]|nr:LuxR C-terminal-related transcriptional regulator [Devosia sp.]
EGRQMGSRRGAPTLPEPPYHLRGVDMIYLMARFDPAAIAPLVPEGLTPSGTGWGTIAAYVVNQGWGIAPYTGFFICAELAGADSPDGSPGQYMHSGLYSAVGGRVMREVYNSNFREGWTRLSRTGDAVVAEVGMGERPLATIRARVAGPALAQTGFSRYLGRQPGGSGFTSYTVAFAAEMAPVEDQAVEFLPAAAEALGVMQPLEFTWTIATHDMAMTFSPPRLLGDAPETLAEDARGAGLVRLFSSMGRPAAMVETSGRVVTLNLAAEALVRERRLPLAGGTLDAALRPLLARAAQGGVEAVSEPMALDNREGSLPLIARAMPLDPSAAGPGRLLVLFDDPIGAAAHDPVPALQLLGLTPAEARIASMVGAGLSPREAASKLDNSEGTVRTALSRIYDKLDIGRQGELARIVTRLGT